MSSDMSEFYEVFFEEAAELLAEMETLLVDLNVDSPDAESLNAIFRAAHSVKGGAATFGFSDMTEVTHALETLLDRLRKNELTLRSDMVDVFLLASDVIKAQLAGHRGEGEADEAKADEAKAKAVCETLKGLASGEVPAPVAPQTAAPVVVATVAEPGHEGKTYRVEFFFNSTRLAFDNLLANLRQTGSIEVHTDISAVAGKADAELIVLEPCVITIDTSASEEDLWEALAFVVDPGMIKVEAIGASGGSGEGEYYGFFEPLYRAITEDLAVAGATPARAASDSSRGRRTIDQSDQPVMALGRRDSDKTVVTSADASSIRVNIDKVDQLINLVGELVITQAMLTQTTSNIDPVAYEALLRGIGQLQRNSRDLQEAVMSIRMMPIGFVFSRFPRLVRDMAGKLNKQVELKTLGEGTELDKGLIEKIADPLTHLLRNSLDHGIESSEKRLAAGKPAKGTITLGAYHQGGNVVIEVSDDGAGLNRDKILAKARERGMPVNDGISDQEIWQLIFEAGFSTAEVVTDISGRGVGMDVVKRNVMALGGRIDIQSALGAGTTIAIRLPLTLAILDGLSIAVGDEIFIVPLTAIIESLQPGANEVKSVGHEGCVVNVRGEYLPVIALHELFNLRPKIADFTQGIMVVLESEGTKKALLVDELVGQHQVVIKSLETNYRRVSGVSGATIMGDGRVALILDVAGLMRMQATGLLEAA